MSIDLVAAGVVLRGNQNQPRANRFRPHRATEGGEDAENDRIGGEDAGADRGKNSEAENERHKERNHDQPTFI